MNVVLEFPFNIEPTFGIQMPANAIIISAQIVDGTAKMFAVVDNDNNEFAKRRLFFIVPTGMPFSDNPMKFIATLQGKAYEFHLFEFTMP